MTKWYERAPGNVSCMRIIAMIGVIIGSIAILAAIVAMFLGMQGFESIAGVGAGVIGASKLSKAYQSAKEGP